MRTRRLGHSGIEVSEVGLGANNFGRRVDLAGTRAVVDAALEAGATFIDTADIYGRGQSEEFLGQVLEGRRDQVVLATKFGMDMGDGETARGRPEYIRRSIEGSLKRLRTEVIDVYWYHEPDGVTPIADTLQALDELITEGKVRAIGASNFDAGQLEEADRVARERGLHRFTAVQNEYSLLEREPERDVLGVCERLELGFVPYFPLASGLLTGKYRRGSESPAGARLSQREQIATDEQFELIEALIAYAAERGVELTDVAIGALLAQPAVSSVIAGATKPEQVRTNARAAAWRPDEEDATELRRLLGGPAPSA
ncbi:MAG TPA: aldo/keto reductase [Solirubrobacteraceae bacterium]|nr:aldo/keto reductase [Solirubrobacteraceae bacterium]